MSKFSKEQQDHGIQKLLDSRWVKIKRSEFGKYREPDEQLNYELIYEVGLSEDRVIMCVKAGSRGERKVWWVWLEPAFTSSQPTNDEVAMMRMLGYTIPSELDRDHS